ncbi:MAG: helix-turn-helix transcriptional regulator [Defluviicoccus sp.]|nr:helix-turn-helix transcriptional regulator [Defluviicoccus sp.]MDE0274895.1 helix-turn-helix transcriptional regulator [Defluviicoccus sp.]
MRTTNAYTNDDTPDADDIDPAALKAARERRGLTQAQLADALGCGKETVSRWERGRSRRLHPRHRESLCATLGVGWPALADAGSGAPDGISGDGVDTAFRLAAERYGVGVRDVTEAAPLLFAVAAERSLAERRQRLDAARAEAESAGRALADKAPWLGRAVAEAVRKEERSIAQNDIFGRLGRADADGDDDRGPFARYLRDLAKDLPESAAALFSPTPEKADEPAASWDESEGRRRLMPHFKVGRVAVGDYLRARRERDEAGLRQWVSEALARAEEEARNASPAPAGT